MNLTDIKSQSISSLKAAAQKLGILVEGDRRFKSTWVTAIQEFLISAQEVASKAVAAATTPEAIESYKVGAVIAAKFAYRVFVISILLTVALGMASRDAWQLFRNWLESEGLTLSQPTLIVRSLASKIRGSTDDLKSA
jgi:hypothetical protein